ncbi:MAG: death-on-curing protein [Flavobacteriales bacterium]|nr:death-on-curing protein [Flavobacteriales bacterium]
MSKGELLIYQTKDGFTQVSVRLKDETLWLTLLQLAELFQRDKSVVAKHIRNIIEEGELEASTVALFATV